MRKGLCEVAHSAKRSRTKVKGVRIAGPMSRFERRSRTQFTRVQVWPPQNMPPKAQPCTRRRSVPLIAIVES
ncbi:hypothetical protein ACVWZR_008607 [Bradyrhizobium sp. i1.3.1]